MSTEIESMCSEIFRGNTSTSEKRLLEMHLCSRVAILSIKNKFYLTSESACRLGHFSAMLDRIKY